MTDSNTSDQASYNAACRVAEACTPGWKAVVSPVPAMAPPSDVIAGHTLAQLKAKHVPPGAPEPLVMVILEAPAQSAGPRQRRVLVQGENVVGFSG